MQNYQVPQYPAIRFFIAWGKAIAVALGLAALAVGVSAWLALGTVWPVAVGAAGGLLLAGLLLCFVELLKIIAETLMPR